MKRFIAVPLALMAVIAGAVPARAQDQGFSVNFGYFWPKGEESRASGDVLNANKCLDVSFVCEPQLFDVDDFGSGTFGAEYIVGVGRFIEVSGGIGYYQKTVPVIYERFQDIDGSEIDSDFKLRIVPITGIVRFVPTGRRAPIQPYAGIGIAALRWHYSESGEFLDPVTLEIFRDQFKADGTEVAPVYLGGVRAPIGDNFLIGGEVRFVNAEGDLDPTEFQGDRIDLGGTTFLANLTWRF
jgi:Outer membrane protein beta-barrel domain